MLKELHFSAREVLVLSFALVIVLHSTRAEIPKNQISRPVNPDPSTKIILNDALAKLRDLTKEKEELEKEIEEVKKKSQSLNDRLYVSHQKLKENHESIEKFAAKVAELDRDNQVFSACIADIEEAKERPLSPASWNLFNSLFLREGACYQAGILLEESSNRGE
jgi:septal ring factor EnvC (AmiA/AmiB activator)